MTQREVTERFYGEVWPHLPAILRAARFLTRDVAEAEDLAQETMIKAFKNLDRFRPGTDMKAWLMTILRNTRIDRLRAQRRTPASVSLDDVSYDIAAQEDLSPEPAWQRPQQLLEAFSDEQVIDALGKLPEEIRWTLMLVDVEGMDHKEAANVLDIPVGTVKSRAHRGRSMLRQELTPLARQMRLIPQADGEAI